MNEKKLFLKNNYFVFTNKILSKIITIGIMIFVARILNEDNFGKFTILISLTLTFAVFQDIGTNFIVVRETAKHSLSRLNILISVLVIKVITGVFCYGGLILFCYLMSYDESIISLAYLYGIGMFFYSLLQSVIKHFEGKERMEYSSFLIISERILLGTAIFYFSSDYDLVRMYGLSFVFSNGLVFLVGLILAYRTSKRLKSSSPNLIKIILKLSYAFVVFSFFSAIYGKLDIYILSILKDEVMVANFRASYQIIEAIYFIPTNICITFLPFFSRLLKNKSQELQGVYSKIATQFIFISLFISVSIFFESHLILETLYNKYTGHYFLFSLLALSMPFYFLNSLNGNLLIALKRERVIMIAMIVSVSIKSVLLFSLLQYFDIQIIGVIILICDMISFLIQYRCVRKSGYSIKLDRKELVKRSMLLVFYGLGLYLIDSIMILVFWSILVGICLFKDIILLAIRKGRAT